MRPSRSQVIGTLAAVGLLAALVVVGRLDGPGRLGRLSAPASTAATPPTPPPAGTTDTTIGLPAPPRLRGVPLVGTGLAALLVQAVQFAYQRNGGAGGCGRRALR